MSATGASGLTLATQLLAEASSRLVRTVDAFDDGDWSEPSLLPGWSRAHVVAHLALNAEGIGRALRSLVADDPAADPEAREPGTMYDSDEQRDADIAELAQADVTTIRDRFLAGVTTLNAAIAAVPSDSWDAELERTPGGRVVRAGAFPGMRLSEVEIHHCDLGAGYTQNDWTPAFAGILLDSMAKRPGMPGHFEVAPLDLPDRRWTFGAATGAAEGDRVPVVTGPAGDLAWWLTGREAPDTLSCSLGELPPIERW